MNDIIEIRKHPKFSSKLFLSSIEDNEFEVSNYLAARICKCLDDLVPVIYEYDTEANIEVEFQSKDDAVIRVTAPLVETNQTSRFCSALSWAKSFDVVWKSESEIVLAITI